MRAEASLIFVQVPFSGHPEDAVFPRWLIL